MLPDGLSLCVSNHSVGDSSYFVCAAIRQAIAKGIVAFYQKCESPLSLAQLNVCLLESYGILQSQLSSALHIWYVQKLLSAAYIAQPGYCS